MFVGYLLKSTRRAASISKQSGSDRFIFFNLDNNQNQSIQLTLEDDHRVPDKVDEAEPAALAQAPLQEVHRAGSADLKGE